MDTGRTADGRGGAASDEQISAWAIEFAVTETQVREAIEAVGTNASDIELHLKGSRSSSNSDRVHDAGA